MTRPYTPDTLAARWECSAETIRQMVHRGELPAFRVGRMLRIPASAVEERETRGLAPTLCPDTPRTRRERPTQETTHD